MNQYYQEAMDKVEECYSEIMEEVSTNAKSFVRAARILPAFYEPVNDLLIGYVHFLQDEEVWVQMEKHHAAFIPALKVIVNNFLLLSIGDESPVPVEALKVYQGFLQGWDGEFPGMRGHMVEIIRRVSDLFEDFSQFVNNSENHPDNQVPVESDFRDEPTQPGIPSLFSN